MFQVNDISNIFQSKRWILTTGLIVFSVISIYAQNSDNIMTKVVNTAISTSNFFSKLDSCMSAEKQLVKGYFQVDFYSAEDTLLRDGWLRENIDLSKEYLMSVIGKNVPSGHEEFVLVKTKDRMFIVSPELGLTRVFPNQKHTIHYTKAQVVDNLRRLWETRLYYYHPEKGISIIPKESELYFRFFE